MKIAVWHNLNSGGGKRALYDHIKGLLALGHTVISYCPDTADQDYLPISSITEERVFPLKAKLDKRISRIKNFNSEDLVYERLQAELEHCKECAADININDFDVLFANSSTYFSMSHIGRFVNIPKVIYLGEPYRYLWESIYGSMWRAPQPDTIGLAKYIFRRFKHLRRMFWYSYIAREEYNSACSYDLILVNSFFSRESVRRVYDIDSTVCYLGIDTNNFLPKSEKKEPFAIGLGTIAKHKGIEQAIESIAKIAKPTRPSLVWVGNVKLTRYAEQLELHAANLGVTLIFKTYISDAELLQLLSTACVMLYFPHLEPFGLAPLEANACGTAVISIKEGGMKETISNGVNGYLLDDFNQEKIAECINKFTGDLAYATTVGKSSRDYVITNWNLDQGINHLDSLIKNLVLKQQPLSVSQN